MREPLSALLVPLLISLGAAVVFHFLPRFSARDLLFAVTVPESFPDSAAGRAALRRYRVFVWSSALLVLVLLLVTAPLQHRTTPQTHTALRQAAFVGGLLLQMIGAFVAFARAHREVMPHSISQATIREADLTPRPAIPGGIAAQLGPFLILSGAVSYVAAHWDRIPERFPIHWDSAGHANGWSTRSLSGVFGIAALGFMVCSLMLIVSYGLTRSARLPRQSGARRLNVFAMLAGSYFAAIVCGSLTVALPLAGAGAPRSVLAVLVAGASLTLVGVLVGIGRVLRHATPTDIPGDATPDGCWKWGQFYNNPSDPALWVPKRIGIGWTLNFGHRWGLPIMIAMVGWPLLVVAVVSMMLSNR